MSSALKKKGRDNLGAGLRVSKPEGDVGAHPAGPPKYGELTQAERAFTLASTFLSGVLAYVLHSSVAKTKLMATQYQRIAISGGTIEAH